MWVVWGEKRNVSDTLRAEGYEVRTARRGSEAMIRVAESLPDLIISDIRMPGMDGYALVRNLRAASRTRLVPIVFLTANKLEAELDRAEIVDRKNIPADVITMRSKVRLKDLMSGESNTYALVFPTEANFPEGKISVLAPIGTAILGYRQGDTIEWPVPSGLRKLKVEEVIYQPESAGDDDLLSSRLV